MTRRIPYSASTRGDVSCVIRRTASCTFSFRGFQPRRVDIVETLDTAVVANVDVSAVVNKRGTQIEKKYALPLVAAFLLCAVAWCDELPPQHSQTNGTESADDSNAPKEQTASTPAASIVERSRPEKAPEELVRSLEQGRFARPTLEKIEQVFRENPKISRETFSNVLEQIKQKDPNLTDAQVQGLRQVYDQKLKSVPPEKVGTQMSAAARTVLDKESGKGIAPQSSGAPTSVSAEPAKTEKVSKNPLQDSGFFDKASEKDGQGKDDEKDAEKKAAAAPPPEGGKRNEVLEDRKSVV